MEHREKSKDVWVKMMALGAKSGCHQRADRSFFIKNCQYPVCARCMGMHIGYIISAVCAFIFLPSLWVCVGCCALMFLDWLVQYVGIKESNNIRRLITGMIGGYGVLTFEIKLVVIIAGFLIK